MDVWIITKKRLAVIAVLFVSLIAALCVSLNALSATVSSPARKIPVYSVETEKKQVALTINAAWDNADIPELLSIFKKYDIKATFFFVGDFINKYPESVKAVYDAGHCIGNHSDKHPDMVKQDAASIRKDIAACNEKLRAITGSAPVFFRAPSGSYDNKTVEAAESLEMLSIQWDVDSIDWKDLSADEITKRVLTKTQNGSIVLFHSGKENTPKALPGIIEQLTEKGFSFVTLDELVLRENYSIDHAGRQHPKQAQE